MSETSKPDNTHLGCLCVMLGTVLIAPTAALEGRVLSDIWRWFILAAHPEWPSVTWQVAAGVVLIVDLLKYSYRSADEVPLDLPPKEYISKCVARMSTGLVVALITWGGAAILHWWVTP